MTHEGDRWHIKLIQKRLQTLNLTFEPATQIHNYEQDKDNYSSKYHFSD